jgi:uncharacterized membrane protein
MATLSVWKFDASDGATAALATLRTMHAHQLVQLQDAAIVSWPSDANRPSIMPLHSLVGPGTLGGSFWGALYGLVFLVPILGLAIATGFGPLIAPTDEIGIDEKVVKELRDKITRGSSALMLLTVSAVTEAVLDDMQAQRGHAGLIEANLTREQESRLRKTFVAEPQEEPVIVRRSAA